MKKNPLTNEQQAEINDIRSTSFETLRPTVLELEKILYKPLPVLDHGFIRVVDYMGDDSAIVQAARVSYGKGTKRTRDDSGLINYLMRNSHTSPFEICEIKLHVKLPIFIARQWIRHRTANVNEYSARYSVLDNEFYIPDIEQLRAQSSNNHQGRGDLLEVDEANKILSILQEDSLNSYTHYEEMLNENFSGETINNERTGLARELARMNLSLGFYTQWYWKIDLHNLMHFLRLRADAHAQWEIREYADVIIEQILKPWLPITYNAFLNYRLGGMQLSEQQLKIVQRLVTGENVQHNPEDISTTEWRELMQNLEIKD